MNYFKKLFNSENKEVQPKPSTNSIYPNLPQQTPSVTPIVTNSTSRSNPPRQLNVPIQPNPPVRSNFTVQQTTSRLYPNLDPILATVVPTAPTAPRHSVNTYQPSSSKIQPTTKHVTVCVKKNNSSGKKVNVSYQQSDASYESAVHVRQYDASVQNMTRSMKDLTLTEHVKNNRVGRDGDRRPKNGNWRNRSASQARGDTVESTNGRLNENDFEEPNRPQSIRNMIRSTEHLSLAVKSNDERQGYAKNNRGGRDRGRRPRNRNWRDRSQSQARDDTVDSTDSRLDENGFKEPNRPQRPIGFKLLQDWNNRDAAEVLIEIVARQDQFKDLLASNIQKDVVLLIVRVLVKVCSLGFVENKLILVNLVVHADFIDKLDNYMKRSMTESVVERKFNSIFWANPAAFFTDIATLADILLVHAPRAELAQLARLVARARACCVSMGLSENMRRQLDDLSAKYTKGVQRYMECGSSDEEDERVPVDQSNEESEPPNSFRYLSVYPTLAELSDEKSVFLRGNVLTGPYQGVEHYLDVHFRLLKEDFVSPLRKGLHEYLNIEFTKNKKVTNVRVYRNCVLLRPWSDRDTVGILVQFLPDDAKNRKRRSDIQRSKRLLFGSLVCFSNDNFATYRLAKVIHRDLISSRGQIAVEFRQGHEKYALNQPYVMVECRVFFEPYFHVLRALQNLYENKFPLREYIVDVSTDVESPTYLQNNRFSKHIDLGEHRIALFGTWPSANALKLDDSQYEAFKTALTSKLALIQGPPGCGKTFIGLKIVNTLIQNASLWHRGSPILIVCYTNHALDQFLEGLIHVTDKVLRIGGQSRNQAIAQFGLKQQRLRVRLQRQRNFRNYFNSTQRELAVLTGEVKAIGEQVGKIEAYDGVLNFRQFFNVDPELASSWFGRAQREHLLRWLFVGYNKMTTEELNAFECQNIEESSQLDPLDEEPNEDDNRRLDDVEDLIDIDEVLGVSEFKYSTNTIVSIADFDERLKEMYFEYKKLLNTANAAENPAILHDLEQLSNLATDLKKQQTFLKMQLKNLSKNTTLCESRPVASLANPEAISPKNRWKLYNYWLLKTKQCLIDKLVTLQHNHRKLKTSFTEMRDAEDVQLMRQMLIVGMTTTAAARLQSSLQSLGCPIVIVEEAAEVLESHIVVSLTHSCEHLIMIGDHQQLRPSTADYDLDKDYNLGVSLFERLINNNLLHRSLNVQHRMRPEIAQLISPNIYPELHNHSSVLSFEHVRGVQKSLYFISHQRSEDAADDNSSKSNLHEVEFLVRLAKHLVLNGYAPQDITILAAYSAQYFLFQNELKPHEMLANLPVKILDNFQGEESKIILLSLVRSNDVASVGFLRLENRVCVALSRAKEGMYIMGDMRLLASATDIWPKIRSTLEEQDALGVSLPLECKLHNTVLRVSKSTDFDRVPSGGCNKSCETTLDCGHVCHQICHAYDREHKKFVCKTIVERVLKPCGHRHWLECSIDVTKFQCMIPVTAELPCRHIVSTKPCHANVDSYRCPVNCSAVLETCGHTCKLKCHIQIDPDHIEYQCKENCKKIRLDCSTKEHLCPRKCHEECLPCLIKIKKPRSDCQHFETVECRASPDEKQCEKPCKRLLPCGHPCKLKCFETCGGCNKMVKKVLPECMHTVTILCGSEASLDICEEACQRVLPCGHACTNKCGQTCSTKCEQLVKTDRPTLCGHEYQIKCYMATQNFSSTHWEVTACCDRPCYSLLECGHRCSGTCGSCLQGRIHQPCRQPCSARLLCGHECPLSCAEPCQPCERPCLGRCQHRNKCPRKCGFVCQPCSQPCPRQCVHGRCNAKCGVTCTIKACDEPCPKSLPCKHPCVGLCGDPCPNLCPVCKRKEFANTVYGYRPNGRYVLLKECSHIIEHTTMDGLCADAVRQGDETGRPIAVSGHVRCPKCETVLYGSTRRYRDVFRALKMDLLKMTTSLETPTSETEKLLTNKLDELAKMGNEKFVTEPVLEAIHHTLMNFLSKNDKNGTLSLISPLSANVLILDNLLKSVWLARFDELVGPSGVDYLVALLRRLSTDTAIATRQKYDDYGRELRRLARLVDYARFVDYVHRTDAFSANRRWSSIYNDLGQQLLLPIVYDDFVNARVNEQIVQLLEGIRAKVGTTLRLSEPFNLGMFTWPINHRAGAWYRCRKGHVFFPVTGDIETCDSC